MEKIENVLLSVYKTSMLHSMNFTDHVQPISYLLR